MDRAHDGKPVQCKIVMSMVLTRDNCRTLDDNGRNLIRIVSEGYGVLGSGSTAGPDIETILRGQCWGVEIRESPTTGTASAPMIEYSYETTTGAPMWLYAVTHWNVDDYQQEWIVSKAPLDWQTAADLLEQARVIAYGRDGVRKEN